MSAATGTQPTDRLVTIREAAYFLAVDPQTIRRRIAKGQLRGYYVGDSPKAPIRVALSDELAAQADGNALLRPVPASVGGAA